MKLPYRLEGRLRKVVAHVLFTAVGTDTGVRGNGKLRHCRHIGAVGKRLEESLQNGQNAGVITNIDRLACCCAFPA